MIDIDITGIVISPVFLPIPLRGYSAVRRGHQAGDPIGFGSTEAEAIADLMEQE
jgi:hypothetical protein